MPEVVSWKDATGSTTLLTGTDLFMNFGPVGWDMPPIDYIEDVVPLQPGSQFRQLVVKPRDFDVPLSLVEVDEATAAQKVRALARTLNPALGSGYLVVTSADGTQRQIPCQYKSGLEGDQSLKSIGQDRGSGGFRSWRRFLVVFHAFDPYWQDLVDTTVQFNIGTSVAFFPILPLRLSAASVGGTFTVNNVGDVQAWPVWTVTGPGSSITFTNNTTGQSLALGSYALAGGRTLTIDTRPGFKTITLDDGTNLYNNVAANSVLWGLNPGNNTITASVSGTSSTTSILLAFRQRYLTK